MLGSIPTLRLSSSIYVVVLLFRKLVECSYDTSLLDTWIVLLLSWSENEALYTKIFRTADFLSLNNAIVPSKPNVPQVIVEISSYGRCETTICPE